MSDNKGIVIVTGGCGLLGRAILHDLRKKGYVAINFDVSIESNLDDHNVHCDVTDDLSIRESVDLVLRNYERIDGLVNNAYPRTSDWGVAFEEDDLTSWRKNVDIQMNSYVACCQTVLKAMKKQASGGAVVNIASIYGVVGNDFTIYENTTIKPPAAYSAIKGGLINFTRYLASFYGQHNIRVNCVSPGGIYDHQPEAFVKAYEHKVPMKRMGKPEDISPAVSFLLSEEARYITGQNLIVDGGWTAI
ncbi:Legionaminic acid biosynthesis protein PtmA [Fulvivirga imtechensis AK7]|uniref:Legionaminic acid biosynthesis protein PtmA n=1 Tax=Fulvivirga imtechensis AK7 TaxID=1237149 RepID=L8JNR5_9BACT|nr:SDR family oxidoreductase [Fulvivirga imtechensis]ELR70606.1 Legionaminic acid biosynthesis protein PtmA [Fulvivirga imtechensis AK7]